MMERWGACRRGLRHNLAEGWVLMIEQQIPEFRVYQATGGECDCKNASRMVAANAWHHFAGSYKDGTSRLFLDGQEIMACACGGQTVRPYPGTLDIGTNASNDMSFDFLGVIDDAFLRRGAMSGSY